MEKLSIKLRVRAIMIQKGMKPSQKKLMSYGLGYVTAREILHKEPKSIKFVDMLKLCIHLNCTPRELMEVNVPDEMLHDQHPLRAWMADKLEMPMNDIYNLSQEQIKEVADMIATIKQRDWGERGKLPGEDK